VLAAEGLVEGVLGHVSARVGPDRMLIRCRGPEEHGLAFTTAEDVRLVDLDGKDGEVAGGWAVPNELPIHGEVLRARPEVGAVVHAHPPAVLLCGIARLELRPVFGAYNIPATRMALDGVPTYPRSVLIRRADLAAEMLEAMGDRPVCVLRGHGITATGASVEQAVVRALNLTRWPPSPSNWPASAASPPRSLRRTSPSCPTSAPPSTTRRCGATTSTRRADPLNCK
jgi:ribulose-5-phosphate 4-epimerase/fuculose-1-phosphate aldolase